jgi:NAD(P)-dependent dehydrogenase (short-subunit alcohol dehydrogenase family)
MINHLAPFSLTHQVLDLLYQSKKARIINVSSMIHSHSIDFDNLNGEKFYSGDNAYSLTKLMNILFTYALSEKLQKSAITVNALHPGVINTKLLRAGWGAMGGDAIEGAQRIFYLAHSEKLTGITGKYFMNDKATPSAPISYDKTVQKRLWEISDAYMQKN